MQTAFRFIMYAQVSLIATLFLCVVSNPAVVWTHAGLSYYGNFQATLFPYALGLGLAALCFSRAADSISLQSRHEQALRIGLKTSALTLVGIVASPTLASAWSGGLHVVFGAVLFMTQAATAFRLLPVYWHDRPSRWFLALQVVGLVGIVLSFRRIDVLAMMLPAQLLAIAGFTLLAMRMLLLFGRRPLRAAVVVPDSKRVARL